MSETSNSDTNSLRGTRVAVLACEGFEEPELTEPVKALKEAGASVDVISEKREPLRAFRHHDPSITVEVDKTFADARPADYDALLLPGGALNADAIRALPEAQTFVRAMDDAHKPMAVICHAPWLLVSAGLASGRTMTSWGSIQDDLKNAGADWVDQEVVRDGNLVTSRSPKDLPAFNRAMVELFAAGRSGTPA